jgi:hypothetical protein
MDKQNERLAETLQAEGELDLSIDDLEDRSTPDVHGGCACSTTCDCTSCSCVAWAA